MNRYRVLLAEDDKSTVEFLQDILEEYFSEVTTAYNGEEALEIYRKNYKAFDLVISDIIMPKLDGLQLCKEIYNINKHQKIIIISAYNDEKYLIPFINIGVDRFIKKPFKTQEFNEVLSSLSDYIVVIDQNCIYDRNLKILKMDDKEIKLVKNEIKLLEILLDNYYRYLTLVELFDLMFDSQYFINYNENKMRLILKRLRAKLPSNVIINQRTLGYKIKLL
jgi:DNA-binding response OmpR family regulator